MFADRNDALRAEQALPMSATMTPQTQARFRMQVVEVMKRDQVAAGIDRRAIAQMLMQIVPYIEAHGTAVRKAHSPRERMVSDCVAKQSVPLLWQKEMKSPISRVTQLLGLSGEMRSQLPGKFA